MGVTYTTAADRDTRRVRVATLDLQDAMLAGASLLAVVAIFAAYLGSTRAVRTALSAPEATVDLNTVADARALEQVLQAAMDTPAERRMAALELFAFLVDASGKRRVAPNVGVIARLRAPVDVLERAGETSSAMRDRLEDERRRAAAAGRAMPSTLPVFTPAQIALIKPGFVVRDHAEVRGALWLWAALYIAAFHAVSILWRMRGIRGDRLLLVAAHVLTAVGFAAMVSRPDPLRDVLLFVRYAQGVVIGLGVAGMVSLIDVRKTSLRELSYVPLIGAFALSVALILFGSGPVGSNAKVNLGPIQPIEAIRVLLALFLAGYFAQRWELLRAVRSANVHGVRLPSWLNLPRARYAVPVLVGVASALMLFFFQKDLGPALMLAVVFLVTYGIARGTAGLMFAGATLLAAGFYLGYRLEISATLAERVRMWQSPWDNTARGGDQIAHALWSLSTGGVLGTGAGLGGTSYLPAGHTDLVLAAVAEEFGFAGLMAVGMVYAALFWRALATARKASGDYAFFLAIVLTLCLAVPVLLMASGIIGLVPLTGVVTPFLSFGGSAMVANFTALGLLAAIRSETAPSGDLEVFRTPIRWLGGASALAAVVLVVVAGRVQTIRADEIVVKPHLGLQADGMRRYQYNPRVLDIARLIPRGTIVDRQGIVLATDEREALQKLTPAYDRLGVSLTSACPDADTRCYPFGGRTYHLLGDVRSRTNWSASNTSFVERDSEARLRGFDDHSTAIPVRDASGAQSWTVRRDYQDLIPLLRHRYDAGHPAVKAAMGERRELRLTIDARLQVRVAAIVADYARRSASHRAAAVVLDPDTGDLLASVSYPWPSEGPVRKTALPAGEPSGELLDRARYGLYPPGSTFKLVTAASALRRGVEHSLTCSRLPDGRVGARVPGFSRPIRDDVMDTRAHGTIDLHRALVVSCNAYFAQLAVRLGPRPLIETAEGADVLLARGNGAARIRDTLPQIGYGQGDVVASPMRMARIAAAIAANGALRDVRTEVGAPASPPHVWLSGATARMLGRYMRDVVLDGTGRSVRGNPVAIAGKTGTAEVDDQPSHSWFVGFAPYANARRRVAVAVIVENAGYGGSAAAPAAGEIVTAAAALGLAQ
jgi:cell division protein FtsW (lipid II flippase)